LQGKIWPSYVDVDRKGKYVRRRKRFSLLANASARTPAREQLIDQLIVLVLGSRRGCCLAQTKTITITIVNAFV
jgi:hypothetical protein